jgi:hypothetical protein
MYNECRHIMPSGKKCHSPALKSQAYCYYHNHLRRYSGPPSSEHVNLHAIEDNHGIQIALTQVLTALNSPYMDTRRAGLMLYGLQLAIQLANRISDVKPSEAVRTCEETDGAVLAPEESVCEPPHDCRDCPRQETCEDYQDPDEEEEEEEEEEQDEEEEEDAEEEEDEEEDALIRKALSLIAPKPDARRT